jgi:hypothetical protein
MRQISSPLLGLLLLGGCHAPPASGAAVESAAIASDPMTAALDSYVYCYPLVLLEQTRRLMTNAPTPQGGVGFGCPAPVNQWGACTALPDPTTTNVIRPNVDTLYSTVWLDLSREPQVIHAPDTSGRYYVMQIQDAFTNTFASPGPRTTGTGAQDFAIVGPYWHGHVPFGLPVYRSPTNMVWIIERMRVNGPSDLPAVAAVSQQFAVKPLHLYEDPHWTAPVNTNIDPTVSSLPPPVVVAQMDTPTFFGSCFSLLPMNPPAEADAPIVPELALTAATLADPATAASLANVSQLGQAQIKAGAQKALVPNVNDWTVNLHAGAYGTNYMLRAIVAMIGLGANLAVDAVYPIAFLDGSLHPLTGANSYTIHFAPGQTPPANGFWSVTMYNQAGYLVANPANKYAILDRDPLQLNADGSLDLVISPTQPASGTSNWLPAPSGPFNLAMRLYWPKDGSDGSPSILNGTWTPPPIQLAQ